MAVFEQFPYTNFHEMNLDYTLKTVKDLGDKVDEFTELLESGPVTDVKTLVNGVRTTIKDNSGVANLPMATDATAGVVTMDAISDDVLRVSGADTYDVPILDNGMISADQLPPTVEPATAAAFGTVKLASSGSAVTVTGGAGAVRAAALNANGDISADVIPASGATAGTYAAMPATTDANRYELESMTVGADGRITSLQQNPYPIIRTDIATIAAGSYTQSIYFDTANYPWYNNACFVNVNVLQQMTDSKGTTYLQALVPGTDYTWNLRAGLLNVTLTAAKTSPVYVCANGCYGRRSM